MNIRLTGSTVCFILVLGCGSVPEEHSSEGGDNVKSDAQFLDYGLPVAENEIVTRRPEPYDSNKHYTTTDSTPHLNRATDPEVPREFLLRRQGRVSASSEASGPSAPSAPPGDGDQGFFINTGWAIYARNDLQNNLSIPTSAVGTTIYAPTHQSAGGACIETVMAHWRPSASSATLHGHGFWDWCRASPGWGVFENINSTWTSKYARSDGSEDMYYTEVVYVGNDCWEGHLWNYNTGTWETKLTSCGTTKTGFGSTGWTMWESWSLTGCPTFPDVKSTSIQIYNGSWVNLAPAHTSALGPSPGSCFASGTYSFHTHTANSYWEAHTP